MYLSKAISQAKYEGQQRRRVERKRMETKLNNAPKDLLTMPRVRIPERIKQDDGLKILMDSSLWFIDSDRDGATKRLEPFINDPGAFVVRKSQQNYMNLVITYVTFDKTISHVSVREYHDASVSIPSLSETRLYNNIVDLVLYLSVMDSVPLNGVFLCDAFATSVLLKVREKEEKKNKQNTIRKLASKARRISLSFANPPPTEVFDPAENVNQSGPIATEAPVVNPIVTGATNNAT